MRKHAIFVAATALLVSAITIAVAAPEAVEKPAAVEFGSPMAKAHPDQARAMLAAAQKAWQANKASYDVGTTMLANVHLWSRQLLLAERALAKNQDEDLAALTDYWKRNKQTYVKVRALYTAATRGGEAERFAEASYYLAEAELWLVAAGGKIPDNLD